MTDEEKKIYARRITEANPMELIVVLYDMLLGDLLEAQDILSAPAAGEANEPAGTLTIVRGTDTAMADLRHAERVVDQLRSVLSFQGEAADMSRHLYSLYDYMLRQISKALYLEDAEPVKEALKVAEPLREAFIEAAKSDKRGPMMSNAESTLAGLTYGRAGLSEYGTSDPNRGFFV